MTLSNSPLCPHFDLDLGPFASWSVKPAAIKVFTQGHAAEVKAVDPGIVTVLRRYVASQGEYLAQGEAGGRRWVQEIPDLTGVDILEGTNEATGFDDVPAIQANNAFHMGFVEACQRRGVTPCILNIAVGNPREDLVRFLAPCVQAAGLAGGYIGYHGYGPVEMLSGEEYLSNRGPLKLTGLLRQAGVTAPIRWIYTEAGLDEVNSPVLNGPIGAVLGRTWAGRVVDEAYIADEHERFAARLVALGVRWAFLYTFRGGPTWEDYDYLRFQRLREWYAGHLERWQAPDPVPPVPPPTPPPSGAGTYTVIAPDGLRVREAPNTGARVLGVLPFGARVLALSVAGGWARLGLSAGGAQLVAGASDPDPCGYVDAGWLRRV